MSSYNGVAAGGANGRPNKEFDVDGDDKKNGCCGCIVM
jgi:hypothetical protein